MAGVRKRTEASFIVRLWREAGASSRDSIRGGVQDIVTGERLFFSELADLNAFLRSHLRPDPHADVQLD